MEEQVVLEQTEQEVQEQPKPSAPTKKDLYARVKELEAENADLKSKNEELLEYTNNAQTYIDKLYENSNAMANKLDNIKHHVDSINKTEQIITELFTMINERINYVYKLLDTNKKGK